MKIYIHTDLEGISGIDTVDMVMPDRPRYQEGRELLMGDVNAAIDGAFAGGATEVSVLDSHGGSLANFIPGRLDPRARQDTKPNKKWWGILDESFAGTFFIGAHAMAGTQNGFLDHTQSSESWHDYSVNGRRMGELGQWAIVAGHWGVPMLMVSGDEAACVEARQFFLPLETAVVKRGVGRSQAVPARHADAGRPGVQPERLLRRRSGPPRNRASRRPHRPQGREPPAGADAVGAFIGARPARGGQARRLNGIPLKPIVPSCL